MAPRADDENAAEKQLAAKKKPSDIESDVARTRAEFAATLDEIEDRINPRIQLRRARSAVRGRLENDPKLLAGAAAGAAGLAAVVAGVARAVSRARR